MILNQVPFPSVDAERPQALLSRCPEHAVTPLLDLPELAETLGIARLSVKDERQRMGLGSFKALGAAYVIADLAQQGSVSDRTFVTASAGNHGLSVAAGAQAFGAKAVIYLSETVPAAFEARLAETGAKVIRAGADYEASMAAALEAAEANGWTLLSDSSWEGYTELPHRLMEGYTVLAAEAAEQLDEPPTQIFLQAGVGGMAAAVAAYARKVWADGPTITVVEPEAAPCIRDSVTAQKPLLVEGPVSNMGRLDCKEPSLIALQGLARDADAFMTISDAQALHALDLAREHGLDSTPSGIAGLAGLLAIADEGDPDDHALIILSEGPE